MTIEDLRQAYAELDRSAPSRGSLDWSRIRGARRRDGWKLVAAAAGMAVLITAPFVTIRSMHSGGDATVPASGGPVTFATSTLFGPKSLTGYELTTSGLSTDGESDTFAQRQSRAGYTTQTVSVNVYVASAANRAKYERGTRITFGTTTGFWAPAPAGQDKGSGANVVNTLTYSTSTRLVVLSGTPSQQEGTLPIVEGLGLTGLEKVARSLKPQVDDKLALAELGYVPSNLVFSYSGAYLDQGTMLSPDGTVGSGYRVLSFDNRAHPGTHSELDIVSVYDPVLDLTTATASELPALDGTGPWSRTTVAGHPAWVEKHTVLIQWGKVQIGIASSRVNGDTSAPLLSSKELLRVAASLTVPASTGLGSGFSLRDAIPAGALA